MIKLSKGFTLLELMVTISIAGILMSIAIPNFSSLLKNNRLITQNNNLLTALSLGKNEALKRGLAVTLCKRNSAGNDCNTGASWTDGWLLYSDQNGDSTMDTNEIIRVYEPLATGISLSYALNQATFNNLGFSPGSNGTFMFCDDRGTSFARGLIIANTGQIHQAIDTDSDSDSIKEDHTGTNFTCPSDLD